MYYGAQEARVAFIGVGSSLRTERMRQGLTLADVAKRTRIQERLLEDIEAERFDDLPGTVFARNFVRQYAMEVGLDPEPLLAELPRVDIESAPMPVPQQRERRGLWDPRRNAAIASVAWLLLAAVAAVGAYVHFNKRTVSVLPEPVAQRAPVPEVRIPNPVAQPLPKPVENARPVQVVLTARESAWVQITSDGKNDFTGTLQANDKREIGADQFVKVMTGNAGGVAITLNGKQLDPLGPVGQIRTVRLTAEGPQLIVKAPPPPPAADPLD